MSSTQLTRGPRARRAVRERSRGQSDLRARVLAAIPAIAVALFLVIVGGAVFALGMFVFGCICLHELFAMYSRTRPARLAGFLALAGLLAAAHYGGSSQVLLVLVASLPLVFSCGGVALA